MKRDNIIFYIATGLLSVLLLFSISMYFFKHEDIVLAFNSFGYPAYLIYPYAIIKLLGLFAIWSPNLSVFKEWAYAGFFFAFILAFFAHYMIGDGEQGAALVAFILLLISYIFNKKTTK